MIKRIIRYIKHNFIGQHVSQKDLSMSALDIAIDTVTGNGIEGDYLEFGVYKGDSFARAYKRFADKQSVANRRFIAFDSFQGLPDAEEHHKPKQYEAGAYSASINEFQKNLRRKKVDLSHVLCIEGFYDTSLTPKTKKVHEIDKVAVAYIDVDLYTSAVPVFDFLTDIIETGSVLVIDDWFRHRGVPTAGIQKACFEWLLRNPDIELVLLHQWRRIAFVVHKKGDNQ